MAKLFGKTPWARASRRGMKQDVKTKMLTACSLCTVLVALVTLATTMARSGSVWICPPGCTMGYLLFACVPLAQILFAHKGLLVWEGVASLMLFLGYPCLLFLCVYSRGGQCVSPEAAASTASATMMITAVAALWIMCRLGKCLPLESEEEMTEDIAEGDGGVQRIQVTEASLPPYTPCAVANQSPRSDDDYDVANQSPPPPPYTRE